MKSRYGLEIRATTAADAGGLAELFVDSGHPIPPATLAARLGALRQESGAALIALEWGPPSGIVVLHWHHRLDTDQPVAQITTLLVAPDSRRKGIARLLIKAAAQAARSAGCGSLELLATEESLRSFCAATGFAAEGTRFVRGLRKRT